MNDLKIGQLIEGSAQRDAIHVAVVPLVAGETLYRGTRVRLKSGSLEVVLKGDYNEDAIGIVDPFLSDDYCWRLEKGQRFWCFLFPGSVTGMRHEWQHPAFMNVRPPGSMDEEWLREFADRWNFDWDELIQAATCARDPNAEEWEGPYVTARGVDLHSAGELGEDHDLFWEHLEGYTGQKFDQAHREGMGWSCTC